MEHYVEDFQKALEKAEKNFEKAFGLNIAKFADWVDILDASIDDEKAWFFVSSIAADSDFDEVVKAAKRFLKEAKRKNNFFVDHSVVRAIGSEVDEKVEVFDDNPTFKKTNVVKIYLSYSKENNFDIPHFAEITLSSFGDDGKELTAELLASAGVYYDPEYEGENILYVGKAIRFNKMFDITEVTSKEAENAKDVEDEDELWEATDRAVGEFFDEIGRLTGIFPQSEGIHKFKEIGLTAEECVGEEASKRKMEEVLDLIKEIGKMHSDLDYLKEFGEDLEKGLRGAKLVKKSKEL